MKWLNQARYINQLIKDAPCEPAGLDSLSKEESNRLEDIADDPSTLCVAFREENYNAGNARTVKVYNCVTTILFGSRYMGLSHYCYEEPYPAKYLKSLMNDMQDNVECASIVGGSKKHFKAIAGELYKRDIPIISAYLDDWSDSTLFSLTKYRKDVFVLNKTKEVFIDFVRTELDKTSGYMRLPKFKTTQHQ